MASLSLHSTIESATQANTPPVWKVERHQDGRVFTDWFADGVTWHDHEGAADLYNIPPAERDQLYPHSTRTEAEKHWLRKHGAPFAVKQPIWVMTPRRRKGGIPLPWPSGIVVALRPYAVKVLLSCKSAARWVPVERVKAREVVA